MSQVRRINARKQLFRLLQHFFEQQLGGLWTISDVVFDPPEFLPKEHGRRQLHRETVRGHFGPYTICLSSPEEKPPLGEVVYETVHGQSIRGNLDPVTWQLIGSDIRLNPRGQLDVDDRRGYRPFS